MATPSVALTDAFTSRYSTEPNIYSFAPGRLNFIGEHIDYLGGHVVPAAIDFGCSVLLSAASSSDASSDDDSIHFTFASMEVDADIAPVEFSLPADASSVANGKSLRTIVLGAMIEGVALAKTIAAETKLSYNPNKFSEFKGLISSTIPIGAGLSSSAALCVALIQSILKALLPTEYFTSLAASAASSEHNKQLDQPLHVYKNNVAKAAQRVENIHCGTNCGIMDQYASIHGKSNTILEVDCAEMTHAAVPLFSTDIGGYQVFLINSMRAHDLGSNYNEVRADLAAAEEKINKYLAENNVSLKDSTSSSSASGTISLREMAGKTFSNGLSATALIDSLRTLLSPLEHGRSRYAVSEMERVVEFVALAGNSSNAIATNTSTSDQIVKQLGALLSATHDGLANQLLVSTVEIDKIVAICRSLGLDKVFGARIMGGGFGGCVLALVAKPEAAAVEAAVKKEFALSFPELGECSVYKVALCDGATVTSL